MLHRQCNTDLLTSALNCSRGGMCFSWRNTPRGVWNWKGSHVLHMFSNCSQKAGGTGKADASTLGTRVMGPQETLLHSCHFSLSLK